MNRSRYISKKEILAFPDLQNDDEVLDRKYNRKPSGLARGSNTSRKSMESNKKPQKSARELKRERLVREIHNFDKMQIAASQPDPEEEKRKAREIAAEQKMRKAVREILDDMMQTIVVEVSLKLGGAMHAQQNAIKNIVDEYLSNNPVVNDRVDNLETKLQDSVQNTIRTLLPDVIGKLQRDMTERVDNNMNTKLERSEQKNDEKIEEFQQEINKQTDQLMKLENEMVSLKGQLESSTSNLKGLLEESKNENKSETERVEQSVTELTDKLNDFKTNFEELKTTTTEELSNLKTDTKRQKEILQQTIQGVTKGKKGKKK